MNSEIIIQNTPVESKKNNQNKIKENSSNIWFFKVAETQNSK